MQEEMEDLGQALKAADVVYMTRVQRERFENQADYEKVHVCAHDWCVQNRTNVIHFRLSSPQRFVAVYWAFESGICCCFL